jgi:hypothetical protein
MSSQGFRERILEIAEDGAALVSSTAETSLFPSSKLTAALAIGYFDRIGKVVEFEFSGQMSNRVTGPDTLRLRLFFGAIGVFDSGLMPLNVVAKTNVHWRLRGALVCRAFGSATATTLWPRGCEFTSESVIGSPAATAGGHGTLLLPFNTAPAVGAGFDNGASQLIDLRATHSVNNANNSIQLRAGYVDVYSKD